MKVLTVQAEMADLIAKVHASMFGQTDRPGWLQALGARFGLSGAPVTLDAAGYMVNIYGGVTRERFRQVAVQMEAGMKGAWVPSMERAAKVLLAESPVLADNVTEVLSAHGLSSDPLSAESFMRLAEITGLDLQALLGTTLGIRRGWLVDLGSTDVTEAAVIAGKHTSKFGMTTAEEVRQALSAPHQHVDIRDVVRVLRADPQIKWAGDWLWVARKTESSHANSMVNHLRSMLSVNSPQSITSLREGVRRAYKFRGRDIVPPAEAMRAFIEQSEDFLLIDETVDAVAPLNYRDVLGPVSAQMVDVLKACPYQVMDRASLWEACRDAGIAPGTSSVWTTYAEWMEHIAPNVWGLRGTRVSPAVVAELRRAAKARHESEPHSTSWTWTIDGQISLVMDVSTSTRTSGVFSFDSALREITRGRSFSAIVEGSSIGQLRFSAQHQWSWGWSPVFLATGAAQGDVLNAVLDLAAGTAAVVNLGHHQPNDQAF